MNQMPWDRCIVPPQHTDPFQPFILVPCIIHVKELERYLPILTAQVVHIANMKAENNSARRYFFNTIVNNNYNNGDIQEALQLSMDLLTKLYVDNRGSVTTDMVKQAADKAMNWMTCMHLAYRNPYMKASMPPDVVEEAMYAVADMTNFKTGFNTLLANLQQYGTQPAQPGYQPMASNVQPQYQHQAPYNGYQNQAYNAAYQAPPAQSGYTQQYSPNGFQPASGYLNVDSKAMNKWTQAAAQYQPQPQPYMPSQPALQPTGGLYDRAIPDGIHYRDYKYGNTPEAVHKTVSEQQRMGVIIPNTDSPPPPSEPPKAFSLNQGEWFSQAPAQVPTNVSPAEPVVTPPPPKPKSKSLFVGGRTEQEMAEYRVPLFRDIYLRDSRVKFKEFQEGVAELARTRVPRVKQKYVIIHYDDGTNSDQYPTWEEYCANEAKKQDKLNMITKNTNTVSTTKNNEEDIMDGVEFVSTPTIELENYEDWNKDLTGSDIASTTNTDDLIVKETFDVSPNTETQEEDVMLNESIKTLNVTVHPNLMVDDTLAEAIEYVKIQQLDTRINTPGNPCKWSAYRTFNIITNPIFNLNEVDVFVEAISKARSFNELALKIMSTTRAAMLRKEPGYGDDINVYFSTVDQHLTEMVNDYLKYDLEFDVEIDSFVDDIQELEAVLKSTYSDVVPAYREWEERMMSCLFGMELRDIAVPSMELPAGIVANTFLVPYSITALNLTSKELGVNTKDGPSVITYTASNTLHGAVSTLRIHKKDSGVVTYKDIIVTSDNVKYCVWVHHDNGDYMIRKL